MMLTEGRMIVPGGLSPYLFVLGFAGGAPGQVVR